MFKYLFMLILFFIWIMIGVTLFNEVNPWAGIAFVILGIAALVKLIIKRLKNKKIL